MLPSRGLRPHQIVSSASRRSLPSRSGSSRKFSSVPRRTGLSALPCRSSPLQPANWRTGAASTSNVLLSASSVRYGSWYAPWSWGRSSTPSGTNPASPSELAPEVTTATPELAPAGIDQPAVVDSVATAGSSQTVEDLLGVEPPPVPDTVPLVDPTAVVTYWGNMKELGLDYGWGPSAVFESLVELSYLNTTLGWGGSICLSALAIRCALFYFQVKGSDAGAKLAAMKPLLQPIVDEIEQAKRAGKDDKVLALKMKQKGIMGEAGGAFLPTLATPIMQGIFSFGAFRCIRGMASLPVPEMSSGGMLWFTDLTVSDPLFILPVIAGGTMYTIMKMGGETGMNSEVQQTNLQKQLIICMPIVFAGVTCYQPAALQLYFVTSAVLGGITARLLRAQAVRSILGIRQLPTPESQALYTKIAQGEIKHNTLRGADGKIRYQAPSTAKTSSTPSKKTLFTRTASSSSSPTPSGMNINIKAGTKLPPHMRAPAPAKVPQSFADRDHDFDLGAPSGVSAKWDWYKRNYRPRFVWRRVKRVLLRDQRSPTVMMEEARKRKAADAAKRYELERQRRMQGR
ncbi:hypothetical protein K458DRAFT_301278 [Lentithecium fluviatile CBS 122367]|uniref:Membrane insertase YidC/Oxa/ALB C-terminal domain-containing protein n=1 Tax=Lentithecium fluviatile CBS 122367 TaxID=1168545 RepID=A0A6G1J569_9PLEO|nr:hypothetical protein K458DRAFT_301278 [Lentithecium fluviatile CBS 122367]